ncbi:MAG: UTRA domain-containing protein [Streptosporangiales bacterium]|nr:UTRA domain-containing protein [Streptosporangiales bacterium]
MALRSPAPCSPTAWRDSSFRWSRRANSSLLQILDADPRTHLASGRQQIRADGADEETAERLQIEPGAPVLRVDRVVYTKTGEPVEYLHQFYRPDRFSFRVHMERMSY